MFNQKKRATQSEDRICAQCEYSKAVNDDFCCGSKKVSPTDNCSKFLFDPSKKKVCGFSVKEKTKSIEFPKID